MLPDARLAELQSRWVQNAAARNLSRPTPTLDPRTASDDQIKERADWSEFGGLPTEDPRSCAPSESGTVVVCATWKKYAEERQDAADLHMRLGMEMVLARHPDPEEQRAILVAAIKRLGGHVDDDTGEFAPLSNEALLRYYNTLFDEKLKADGRYLPYKPQVYIDSDGYIGTEEEVEEHRRDVRAEAFAAEADQVSSGAFAAYVEILAHAANLSDEWRQKVVGAAALLGDVTAAAVDGYKLAKDHMQDLPRLRGMARRPRSPASRWTRGRAMAPARATPASRAETPAAPSDAPAREDKNTLTIPVTSPDNVPWPRSRQLPSSVRLEADGLPRINGRKPINSDYAGTVYPPSRYWGDTAADREAIAQKYPDGVRFTKQGFPDFTPYAKISVPVEGLVGDTSRDYRAANKAAGLEQFGSRNPVIDGVRYVWHHCEDGVTMQLVPKDIHNAVKHTGGEAVIEHVAKASKP